MKRDMELIRQVLLAVEDDQRVPEVLIDEFDEQLVTNHMELLIEGGYAVGKVLVGDDGHKFAYIERLTWDGHELADAMRNDTVWRNTMKLVRQNGGAITIGVLRELLKAQLRDTFGLGV